MNASPDEQLVAAVRVIVDRFGDQVLTDPLRFRNLLTDELGTSGVSMPREVDLIVRVVDPQLIRTLRDDTDQHEVARTVAADRAVDERDAAFAVSTLRAALGTTSTRDPVPDREPPRQRRFAVRPDRRKALLAGGGVAGGLLVVLAVLTLASDGSETGLRSETATTATPTTTATTPTVPTPPDVENPDVENPDIDGIWLFVQATFLECEDKGSTFGGFSPGGECGYEFNSFFGSASAEAFEIDCDTTDACWLRPFPGLGYPRTMLVPSATEFTTEWSTSGEVPPERWHYCESEQVPTEFRIVFQPTGEEYDGGWIATEIEGEFEKSNPCGSFALIEFVLMRG